MAMNSEIELLRPKKNILEGENERLKKENEMLKNRWQRKILAC